MYFTNSKRFLCKVVYIKKKKKKELNQKKCKMWVHSLVEHRQLEGVHEFSE